MRISDWSSDVCSSDLGIQAALRRQADDPLADVDQSVHPVARLAEGGAGAGHLAVHRLQGGDEAAALLVDARRALRDRRGVFLDAADRLADGAQARKSVV